MKKKLKSFCFLISSLVIYMAHLPLAFAKSATGSSFFFHPGDSVRETSSGSTNLMPAVKSLYDSLQLNISGLSRQAFEYAKKGFDKLIDQGKAINDSLLAIVDFSLPSNRKRLYILDLKNHSILLNTLVAHGKNSGREWANSFSNRPSSYKSSPGFYITKETYQGNNGYSLKLEGIEDGINDNAYERGIVIHGAEYVSQAFINAQGFIGRSEGCPAVPLNEARQVINLIKNGSCLFIYSPDQQYLSHSGILN